MSNAMDFDSLISLANKDNRQAGDYVIDGLLHCGKCHTPKQRRGEDINEWLTGKIISVRCSCAAQEAENSQLKAKREEIEELRKLCLPYDSMRRYTFANAEDLNAKHITIAKRYADVWEKVNHENISLAFWGNVGTGKSYAALCIANALLDKKIPVKHIMSSDLVEEMSAKGEARQDFLKKICQAPLLIIDDVGAESDSSYAQTQLCRAIDARRESGKPFVITTNYSLQEIETEGAGAKARIFDRLNGSCVFVKVEGESRRKAEGELRMKAFKKMLEV